MDCAEEMPTHLDVTALAPPELQDARGSYEVDGMYLKESCGSDGKIRLVYWESATSGWVGAEFGSSCTDDVCFFGYLPYRGPPPERGWVFGAPDFAVYYEQMLFDDAERDPNSRRGYHLSVSFTPDVDAQGAPDLSRFNGRYVLQPRYVHTSGKFAIMPIDFKSKRTWVLAGLMGVPRKWRVLLKGVGSIYNMYQPPTTQGASYWEPLNDGMQLLPSCGDHMPSQACGALQGQCGINEPASRWIRECCRATCGRCDLSRNACKAAPGADISASFIGTASSPTRFTAANGTSGAG